MFPLFSVCSCLVKSVRALAFHAIYGEIASCLFIQSACMLPQQARVTYVTFRSAAESYRQRLTCIPRMAGVSISLDKLSRRFLPRSLCSTDQSARVVVNTTLSQARAATFSVGWQHYEPTGGPPVSFLRTDTFSQRLAADYFLQQFLIQHEEHRCGEFCHWQPLCLRGKLSPILCRQGR